MNKPFTLLPFAATDKTRRLAIRGAVTICEGSISVCYFVKSPLSDIVIPLYAQKPGRRDRLWDKTCFELFVSQKDSPGYREYNFSPSGHWNIYCFSSYREHMVEEKDSEAIVKVVSSGDGDLSIEAKVTQRDMMYSRKELLIGVSAVLKHSDGDTSFWALAHPGEKPDFHVREAFLLNV